MKYKVVKEINKCEGCINDRREMCSDFKKQRMSEGLPSCSKGIIYVEDTQNMDTAKIIQICVDSNGDLLGLTENGDVLCKSRNTLVWYKIDMKREIV